jgi:hypothetical protein
LVRKPIVVAACSIRSATALALETKITWLPGTSTAVAPARFVHTRRDAASLGVHRLISVLRREAVGGAKSAPGSVHSVTARAQWVFAGAISLLASWRHKALLGVEDSNDGRRTPMPARTPQQIFQHHAEALGAEDIDGIAAIP